MKFLKRFQLLALLFVVAFSAMAQSTMTDSQIQEYILKETAKGTDRSAIVAGLVEKGVTLERIQKLRKNYERQNKNASVGTRNITGSGDSRMRTANSQMRSDKQNPNLASVIPAGQSHLTL